jgi:hypothetical protein
MAISEFMHKGGLHRRVNINPIRAFTVGADLGQSVDSTVIAIVEYTLIGTGDFDVKKGQNGVTILQERYVEHFDLRELQRIKLKTNYDEIIDHLVALMNTDPLRGANLAIDDTGCGRPFGDMVESQTFLRPLRITSTSGNEATKVSNSRWHVPKAELVSVLSGLFATNRIRLAHDLPNLEVLRRETQTFLRTITASGRSQFSAASGQHDDTLSALSLACWVASMKHSPAWARRRGGEVSTGFVRGMI